MGWAIFVIFFSLLTIFVSSDVWAQTPVFDQSKYVYEHGGYLTIIDSDVEEPFVDVLVNSDNGNVTVQLNRVGNSTTFRSNLILFTATPGSNVHGENPVVSVSTISTIVANYNETPSDPVTILQGTSSLSSINDYFEYLDRFTMENKPDCAPYGEDEDDDYICNYWEELVNPKTGLGPYNVNLNDEPNSYYFLPQCTPGNNYTNDSLGTTVCPDKNIKDVYIEIDYMTSHYPNVEALKKVVKSFLNVPTEKGGPIHLHIFIDDEITHVDEVNFDEVSAGNFYQIKAKEFGFSNVNNPVPIEQVDGIWIRTDNCPTVSNDQQEDSDGDGIGDLCEPITDMDTDGYIDKFDTDSDGDLIPDGFDNCPRVSNRDQVDTDKDGFGDGCDPGSVDFDGDLIPDADDNCPLIDNPNQEDINGFSDNDGFGDACESLDFDETDTDEDTIPDGSDIQKAKAQIFYYYIWAHDQADEDHPSGIAEQGGNDGAVTLGAWTNGVGTLDQQAGTFMHELGHNFGLNHGGVGQEEDNCKPNLLSVMSYSRQFSDLMDRPLDYSHGTVGTTGSPESLGNEENLSGTKVNVTGYLSCPAVMTTEKYDLDFDGEVDFCDNDTVISENKTIDRNMFLGGDLEILSGAVLTIDSEGILNFDSKNHKILVRDGGGLLVKFGGKIIGHTEDEDGNLMVDIHENSPIVFGGDDDVMVENTHQEIDTWASDWKDIRYIQDRPGNFVCPFEGEWEDLTGIELESVDQWSNVTFSRDNDDWGTGRSAGQSNERTDVNTSFDNQENVRIIIKPDSGNWEVYENSNCNDCYSPSHVNIDLGTNVTWVNNDDSPHTVTSVFLNYINSSNKFDFENGELDNHYMAPRGDTYDHIFEKAGTYQYGCTVHPWMEGTICVGPQCPTIDPYIPPVKFDKGGNWCISYEDAYNQTINDPRLQMKNAPLCSNSKSGESKEMTIENVRAARSVSADKIITAISKLDPGEFVGGGQTKGKLIQEIRDIRQNILKDNLPEAIKGYTEFKSSVVLSVKSETTQNQIFKVVDRNIEATSHVVPEFESISILVLVLSITAIIVLSRKNSFYRGITQIR